MKALLVKLALIGILIVAMLMQWNAAYPNTQPAFWNSLFDFSGMNPERADFSFSSSVVWTPHQTEMMRQSVAEAKAKLTDELDLSMLQDTANMLLDRKIYVPIFISLVSFLMMQLAISRSERYLLKTDSPFMFCNGFGSKALYFVLNGLLMFFSATAAMRLLAPLVQAGYVYVALGVIRVQIALLEQSRLAVLALNLVLFIVTFTVVIVALYREREVLYLAVMLWVKQASGSKLLPLLNVLLLLLIACLARFATAVDTAPLEGEKEDSLFKQILITAAVLCLLVFLLCKLFGIFR